MLSVIVPTYGRSACLRDALVSLLEQDFPPERYEIIVVDNKPTGEVREIVRQIEQKWQRYLCYVEEPNVGLHNARHTGAKTARGEILIYVDDDIEACPPWLGAIWESFQDQEVVLVGGKCLPKFEAEPSDWVSGMWQPNAAGQRILGYLSLIDLGDEVMPVDPLYVYGCNFAIRRSVLIEAGGFHPDALPQELIRFRGDGESHASRFIQARGYKALYNPHAAVYHRVPKSRMTIEYFCRRAYNQGISDSYTAIRHAPGLDLWPSRVANTESPPSRYATLYQRIRRKPVAEIPGAVWRWAKRAVMRPRQEPLPATSGATDDPHTGLRQQIAAAYQAGYQYHQDEARRDPKLVEWVLRPHYWDASLPHSND